MFGKIYESTWWGNPTENWGNIYYDLANPINLGSELLTNSDMSSVDWPWNHGSWSGITPTTDGDTASLTLTSDYPATNPRIEQTFVTEIGKTYRVDALVDGQGNAIQLLIVEDSTFTFIDSAELNTSGFENITFDFVATSTSTIIQILVKGITGDVALVDNVSVKEIL